MNVVKKRRVNYFVGILESSWSVKKNMQQ